MPDPMTPEAARPLTPEEWRFWHISDETAPEDVPRTINAAIECSDHGRIVAMPYEVWSTLYRGAALASRDGTRGEGSLLWTALHNMYEAGYYRRNREKARDEALHILEHATLPEFASRDAQGEREGWWCPECKVELPWNHVTFVETHDKRAGGCGRKVVSGRAASGGAPGEAMVREYEQRKFALLEATVEANEAGGDGSSGGAERALDALILPLLSDGPEPCSTCGGNPIDFYPLGLHCHCADSDRKELREHDGGGDARALDQLLDELVACAGNMGYHDASGNVEETKISNSAVQNLRAEIAAALRSASPSQPEPCVWTEDESGAWETGCGRLWVFDDGGPSENVVRYCMNCGHPARTGSGRALLSPRSTKPFSNKASSRTQPCA